MIIVSIDDFRRCAELAKQVGKWQAWYESYFPKYEDIFASMLKYLYRCDVTDLQAAVENFDFEQALTTARKFFQDGNLLLIEDLLLKAREKCGFDKDYDLYLLIGLGHVDGTSLPAKKPFLYFGVERYDSPERLKYLVPHEYNHLVRLWSVYGGELVEGISLGEVVLIEGLAVVFSSIVAGDSSPQNIDSALLMPKEDIAFCYKHREELIAEVQRQWDDVLTSELMDAYMKGSYQWKNGRPTRIGYFVGAHIINSLLAEGQEIGTLTTMPSKKIIELYRQSRLNRAST